jgi:hypothetical protein
MHFIRQRIALPVGGLVLLGFIYPGGPLLGGGEAAQCGYVQPPLVALGFVAILPLLVLMPLAYKRFNSAIYVMLTGIFAASAIGMWFLVTAFASALCPPLPHVEKLLALFVALAVFATLGFWLHLRMKIPRTIEFNGHKWNFDTMEYSLAAPIFRPDGRSGRQVLRLSVVAGVVGILLGGLTLPIDDEQFRNATRDWLGTSALFVAGLWFLGYLVPGELYATWLVHKKAKAMGRKMTVKEFSHRSRSKRVAGRELTSERED